MKQFISINDVADPKALLDQGLLIKADPFAHQHLGRAMAEPRGADLRA